MLRARASSPPAGWGSWCAATASSIGSLKSSSYFFFSCIGGGNCFPGLCGLVLTLLLFLLSLQEAFEDTAAAADGRFCCCQTHGVFLTCREEEEEGWRNGVQDDNGAGGLRVILMVIWFLQTVVGMKWHQAMLACQPGLPKLFFPSSSGSLCPFGCPALFVWTPCSCGRRQPSVFSLFFLTVVH